MIMRNGLQAGAAMVSVPPFRVLVVDDNCFDRARARRMCQASGLPISVAEAGALREMDSLLDQGGFDLLLLDHALQDGCGLLAFLQIGNRSNIRNSAVVVCSEHRTALSGTALHTVDARFLCKRDLTPDVIRSALLERHSRKPQQLH